MMNLKIIRLIILMLLILGLSACYQTKNTDNTSHVIKDTPVVQPPKNPLDSLGKGEIDGFKYKIGTRAEDVIKELGEPKTRDYFMGSEYIGYDNFNLFYNDYIFAMSFFKGNKIFGLEIGKSTPSDIKNLLGTPKLEFQQHEEENDERSVEAWTLVYEVNKYSLEFYSDSKDAPVFSAYVSENKEE